MLAVIIPAYKSEFLAATLESFQKQTDKRFRIYIGDDNSPNDIKTVVDNFKSDINVVYHRFEENLGGTNLVAHWSRCIELSQDEPWIWLFSDDDLVSSNAVATFWEVVSETNLLYKFNTAIIDEHGERFTPVAKFDQLNTLKGYLPSSMFIIERLRCIGFRSFAVEYIFHRSLFTKLNFVELPLAWGADDLTWLNYSFHNHSRIQILEPLVFWRYSGKNISSDHKSEEVVKNKLLSAKLFVSKISALEKSNNVDISDKLLLNWFSNQVADVKPRISFRSYTGLVDDLAVKFSIYEKLRFYFSVILRRKMSIYIRSFQR